MGRAALHGPRWNFGEIPIFENRKTRALPPVTTTNLGRTDNRLENEAHRAAEQVARVPQGDLSTDVTGRKALPVVQRGTAPFTQEVLGSPGQPLDTATRAWIEPRLGHDFSSVRVHTGSAAAESAEGLNARAYAVGTDVAFAAGEFAPADNAGRALLAHELTHVVQQSRGAASGVQRQPGKGSDFQNDSSAAKYRGDVMAKRIREHGRLSKEARAKIQSEVAYFEGAARSAYLKIVNPALKAVREAEILDEFGLFTGTPKPITVMDPAINGPGACGAGPCFTDEEANAPFREEQQRDEAEKQQKIQAQVDELQAQMTDWRAQDKEFALDILKKVLDANPNPGTRGVSDKIRQPLMDRLRKELEEVDAQRKAICAKGDPGFIERARRAGNNDDPCKSWFEGPTSHGPNTLNELERQLNIERGKSPDAANQVYWDVFQFRKLSDPVLIAEQEMLSAALQGLAGVAGGIGDEPVPMREPTTVPEPPTTSAGPKTPMGPDPTPVQGGGQKTLQTRDHLGVVDPAASGGDVVRPVSPKGNTTTPPPDPATAQPKPKGAANDNAVPTGQTQQQQIAAGGGPPGAGQTRMAVKPRTPRPDHEFNRRPPTLKEVQGDRTMSDTADDLDRVSQSSDKAKKGSKQLDEKQLKSQAGTQIEPSTVQAWAKEQPPGASVYTNAEFPPEIKSLYPKTRGAAKGGPDAISIDPANKEVTVFDSTTKPTKEHTAKTVGDAQKFKDNMPDRFKGYKVFAQEGWTDGGLTLSPKKPI